jgi:hypothetical protein
VKDGQLYLALAKTSIGSNHFSSPTSVHIDLSLFGLLRAGLGFSTNQSPFVIQTHSLAIFGSMRSMAILVCERVPP